jgi:endonuclease G, mitochondrial
MKNCVFVLLCNLFLHTTYGQISGVAAHSVSDTLWMVHVAPGAPYDDDPSDDLIVFRSQYVLSYCSAKNTANWVAWQLNKEWYGSAGRFKGSFKRDTLLPDSVYKVKHSDYTNSGFNRGHIVRSEERTATVEDNLSTFYLTNVIPQTPDLNQGVWLNFEYYCENLCKKENKQLYVYSGGVFHTDSTLKGEGIVAVPDSCFKIVLVLDEDEDFSSINDETVVIAVMMPNVDGVRRERWQTYITNVKHIEQSTGYCFFGNLSFEHQEYLKSKTYVYE